MGKLRRSWAELPFEKKLGSVLVPLLVAVIGAGVPLLLAGGGDGCGERELRRRGLEIPRADG